MTDTDELLEEILASAPPRQLGLRHVRALAGKRDRRRRVATSVAALSLLAVVLWGTSRVFTSGESEQPAGPPGVSIDDLPVAGPGQYYYEEAASLRPGTPYSEPSSLLTKTWLAPDGSGRSVTDDPRQAGIGDTSGSHSDIEFTAARAPIPLISLADAPGGVMSALDTQAEASPAVPIASPGPGQDEADMKMLRTFDSLLQPGGENMLDPRSQAAVFDVLVSIPGITVAEGEQDSIDRPATVVTFIDSDALARTWFFTPDTHQVLAYEFTGPGGELYQRTLVLKSGISDSLDTQPSEPLVRAGGLQTPG